jgi:hypothetical protein
LEEFGVTTKQLQVRDLVQIPQIWGVGVATEELNREFGAQRREARIKCMRNGDFRVLQDEKTVTFVKMACSIVTTARATHTYENEMVVINWHADGLGASHNEAIYPKPGSFSIAIELKSLTCGIELLLGKENVERHMALEKIRNTQHSFYCRYGGCSIQASKFSYSGKMRHVNQIHSPNAWMLR